MFAQLFGALPGPPGTSMPSSGISSCQGVFGSFIFPVTMVALIRSLSAKFCSSHTTRPATVAAGWLSSRTICLSENATSKRSPVQMDITRDSEEAQCNGRSSKNLFTQRAQAKPYCVTDKPYAHCTAKPCMEGALESRRVHVMQTLRHQLPALPSTWIQAQQHRLPRQRQLAAAAAAQP